MTSLPTTRMNPDHSICQWTQLPIQHEFEFGKANTALSALCACWKLKNSPQISRTSRSNCCELLVVVSKVKYTSICMALYHDSSLKRLGMARVNEGAHSFTCHRHVYPQVEWTTIAFTPQPQSITTLWLVLISRPAEGRRLSWPGWLGDILRWFAQPSTNRALRWYAQRRYRYATPRWFWRQYRDLSSWRRPSWLDGCRHQRLTERW